MKATFKKGTPVITAIHQFCDSFGVSCGSEINKSINHGVNAQGQAWFEGRADYVAGIIGVLSDMGHGADFLSAKDL
jgi:hypothetical protein